MKPATRHEMGAMWLYHDEHARSRLGCVEFWQHLSASKKDTVQQMLDEIDVSPTDHDQERASVGSRLPEGAKP